MTSLLSGWGNFIHPLTDLFREANQIEAKRLNNIFDRISSSWLANK